MLRLNTIPAHPGATRRKKRLGRGAGSGLGQTSGRGDKGQKARSGAKIPAGFEGGQTPLHRRLPKRGFKNFFRRSVTLINVGDLERLDSQKFSEITLESLRAVRKIKGRYDYLTVLGQGELTKAFHVKAYKVSGSAQEKIKKAGGSVEILPSSKKKKFSKRN